MAERLGSTSVVAARDPTMMQRLDFVLPDFTRVAWVSDRARAVWEPRLTRIITAWSEIEWRSVLEGVRSCAVTSATPEQFLKVGAVWAENGLNALPVEMLALSGQPYDATGRRPEYGQPFVFRLVVGRPRDVAEFKAAWDAGDDEQIGTHLGFPDCCRSFFRDVWVRDSMVDTTWPMATATGRRTDIGFEVSGPSQANILWRWMGARAVPHLPCRFDCGASVELADRLFAVGRRHGFGAEMDWLFEILSWPTEWSALHGIAEIKTPILKVVTRTDATAGRHVVRRLGDRYPDEGVRGLTFPYQAPVKLHLTRTRGFRRGLAHAARDRDARPAWYVRDNGFVSAEAMDAAHTPVVAAAVAALAGRGGTVLDLGCGNGALLEKLVEAAPGVVPYGVDRDAQAIEHARLLHPMAVHHFLDADLFDETSPWSLARFDLVVLMPGRLVEVDAPSAGALRDRLRRSAKRVLVYAYGDWLADQTLDTLAAAAGLPLVDPTATKAALAQIVDPKLEEVLHGS
jgi:SAM-dependent methyltransferase